MRWSCVGVRRKCASFRCRGVTSRRVFREDIMLQPTLVTREPPLVTRELWSRCGMVRHGGPRRGFRVSAVVVCGWPHLADCSGANLRPQCRRPSAVGVGDWRVTGASASRQTPSVVTLPSPGHSESRWFSQAAGHVFSWCALCIKSRYLTTCSHSQSFRMS